jgi:hemoglobin
MHSGNGRHDEMDNRAIACFDLALADVGLADDSILRQVPQDTLPGRPRQRWLAITSPPMMYRASSLFQSGLGMDSRFNSSPIANRRLIAIALEIPRVLANADCDSGHCTTGRGGLRLPTQECPARYCGGMR